MRKKRRHKIPLVKQQKVSEAACLAGSKTFGYYSNSSVGRQDRHFYFRLLFLEELFSLSIKANNATIKLPKDINNANIPMKIEMIS